MNQKQKADIGLRYLASLNSRIRVRKDAQARAAARKAELESVLVHTGAKDEAAKILIKRHRMPGVYLSSAVESTYLGDNKRVDTIVVTMDDGSSVRVPVARMAKLAKHNADKEVARESTRLLCRELEYLHTLIQPARVAEFQAHAGRLWAGNGDETLPNDMLEQMINGFVDAKRPAVCKIA